MEVLEYSLVYEFLENSMFNHEWILKNLQKSLAENKCGLQSFNVIKKKIKDKLFLSKELIVIKNYFLYELKNIVNDLEFYD